MPVLEAPPKATIAAPVPRLSRARDSNRLVVLGTALLVAIFVACATLAAITMLHHEPWRDEADAWLVVRDNSLIDLFPHMSYVGSPALWYLCIFPLAKLGAPYAAMGWLNLTLGILAIALLMFRSPLPFPIKALVPLSCLFLYEYPVVARNYSLSLLLIFGLAAMHVRREKHPWLYCVVLALLANSNVFGLALAIAILTPFAYQLLLDRKKFMPCTVPVVGIFVAMLQLLPRPDAQLLEPNSLLIAPFIALKQAFFPVPMLIDHSYCLSSPMIEKVVLTFLAAIVLGSIVFLIRRSKNALLPFIFGVALFNAIYMHYLGALRHWGFYVVAALYAIWIAHAEQREQSLAVAAPGTPSAAMTWWHVPFFISLCYCAFVGLTFCSKDMQEPFSSAPLAASFLRSMPDAPVASLSAYSSESILPYLPGKSFFYPTLNAYGTHMRFTREEIQDRSNEWLLARTEESLGSSSPLYIISKRPLVGSQLQNLRLLYDTSTSAPLCHDEVYFIYGRHIPQLLSPRSNRTVL